MPARTASRSGTCRPASWIVQANLVFPDGGSRTWFRVHVGV